ncbi:hypothetical protein COL20_10350, partial [Bacillus sp. AFS075034]
ECFFIKRNVHSRRKEAILIVLFSKWLLFIYCKIWVCAILLIKFYFNATPSIRVPEKSSFTKEKESFVFNKTHNIYSVTKKELMEK